MATTWGEIVSNTTTALRKNFDDADIQKSQILFWARVVADRLAKEDISNKESKGEIGGNFLSVFNSVPVKSDGKGKKFIDIPVAIMDLFKDKGIQYLTYGCNTCTGESVYNVANVMFQRTTPRGLNRTMLDPFEKPSASNPYYYRVGCTVDGQDVDRLYLVGAECVNFSDVELGVICGIDSSTSCSLDEVIPLPPELIQTLMINVLQIARFNIAVPEERVNEGSDENRPIAAGVPVAQSNLLQQRAGQQQQQTEQ